MIKAEEKWKYHWPDCVQQDSIRCGCPGGIKASIPVTTNAVRPGKWMIFPLKQNVDETWVKIKTLLAANRLGPSAKLENNEESCVICVYTDDYEDIPDVLRVLIALVRSRIPDKNKNFQYKTNEASKQGIYTNNQRAKNAGFDSTTKQPGKQIAKYFSPKQKSWDPTGSTERINLFQNNIGPESKTGLVAELLKCADDKEARITYYDPPLML